MSQPIKRVIDKGRRWVSRSSAALGMLLVTAGCGIDQAPVAQIATHPSVGNEVPTPQGGESPATDVDRIGQTELLSAIAEFVSGIDLEILHPEIEAPFTLEGMISHGFEQAPPMQIWTEEGERVVWGWNEDRPEDRSLAIFGANGQLQLAAFSHAIPTFRGMRGQISEDSIESYVAAINDPKSYIDPPFINMYIDDPVSLERVVEVSRVWIQAAALGFNPDCSRMGQTALCAIAGRLELGTSIYSIECLRGRRTEEACMLPVPAGTPPDDLSVEAFVQ